MNNPAPLWYEVPAPLSVARCEDCNTNAGPFTDVPDAFTWCATHSVSAHAGSYLPRVEHQRHLRGALLPRTGAGYVTPTQCPTVGCYGVGDRKDGPCDKHRARKAKAA